MAILQRRPVAAGRNWNLELSPLRDNITPTDIDNFYLPEDFNPIGATQ